LWIEERAPERSGGEFIFGLEIELDLHVVGVAKEDLPTGAIGHLVHSVRHALTCQVLLHRLKATAVKRDMIDDA
jgi:hypothetical protein